MPARKYSLDKSFFTDPEKERVCYWAGFLLADGNVKKNGITLQLKLAEKDEDHIERFLADLEADYPIRYSEKPSGKRLPTVRVHSSEMVSSLERYGIVPRKSYGHPLPQNVPEEQLRHFIRGYVDGDGHIGGIDGHETTSAVQYGLFITGQENLIRWIQDAFDRHCDASPTKLQEHDVAVTASYGGNQQVARICSWLYGGCAVALPRKEEVAMRVARLYGLDVEQAVADLIRRVEKGDLGRAEAAESIASLIRRRDSGAVTGGEHLFKPSRYGAHGSVEV